MNINESTDSDVSSSDTSTIGQAEVPQYEPDPSKIEFEFKKIGDIFELGVGGL